MVGPVSSYAKGVSGNYGSPSSGQAEIVLDQWLTNNPPDPHTSDPFPSESPMIFIASFNKDAMGRGEYSYCGACCSHLSHTTAVEKSILKGNSHAKDHKPCSPGPIWNVSGTLNQEESSHKRNKRRHQQKKMMMILTFLLFCLFFFFLTKWIILLLRVLSISQIPVNFLKG